MKNRNSDSLSEENSVQTEQKIIEKHERVGPTAIHHFFRKGPTFDPSSTSAAASISNDRVAFILFCLCISFLTASVV
jgi:hypothetical protein